MWNLFCRTDRLGEFLLTLPSIFFFKKHFSKDKIIVLVNRHNLSISKALPWIDKWVVWDGSVLRCWRELMPYRVNRVFVFNPRKDLHLLSFILGAKQRIGYRRKWGKVLLNKAIPDEKYKGEKHEVFYNLDLISLVTSRVYSWEDIWAVLPEIFSFTDLISELPRNLVVLHPFSSDPRKELDLSSWKPIIERVVGERRELALIGSKEEKDKSDRFFRYLTEQIGITNVYNLVGKLDLYQLGCLFKHHTREFIGVDSGPAHLAGLLGLPVRIVWSYAIFNRWKPLAKEIEVIKNLARDIENSRIH